jgi:hypothetical protein
MAVLKERLQQTEYQARPRTFNISGAVLEVQIIKPDIAILHLEKNYPENVHEGVRPTPFGRIPPQGPWWEKFRMHHKRAGMSKMVSLIFMWKYS